jgi:hypothetical protein
MIHSSPTLPARVLRVTSAVLAGQRQSRSHRRRHRNRDRNRNRIWSPNAAKRPIAIPIPIPIPSFDSGSAAESSTLKPRRDCGSDFAGALAVLDILVECLAPRSYTLAWPERVMPIQAPALGPSSGGVRNAGYGQKARSSRAGAPGHVATHSGPSCLRPSESGLSSAVRK